jgi:hypothetical protein
MIFRERESFIWIYGISNIYVFTVHRSSFISSKPEPKIGWGSECRMSHYCKAIPEREFTTVLVLLQKDIFPYVQTKLNSISLGSVCSHWIPDALHHNWSKYFGISGATIFHLGRSSILLLLHYPKECLPTQTPNDTVSETIAGLNPVSLSDRQANRKSKD